MGLYTGSPIEGKLLKELTYDDRGRVEAQTDADGYATTITYYENDLTKQVDYPNASWQYFEYNELGVKTKEAHPSGNYTPTSPTDPTPLTGEILETVYTPAGNGLQIESIAYPDGRTEAYTYTTKNEVRTHTDGNNVTQWFEYDDFHRPTKKWVEKTADIYPENVIHGPIPNATADGILVEQTTYNDAGDPLTKADATLAYHGESIVYAYSGDLLTVDDPEPVLLETVVEPLTIEGDARTRRFSYDSVFKDRVSVELVDLPDANYADSPGKVATWTTVAGTDVTGSYLKTAEYSYDSLGNVESATDGDGRITQFAYDELNRKKAQWRPGAGETETDPTASWTYDGRGNTLTETAHGINDADAAVVEHQYDNMGRKTRTDYPAVVDPDGGATVLAAYSEEWRYDLAGNAIYHQDADGNVDYSTYDDKNKPVDQARQINC